MSDPLPLWLERTMVIVAPLLVYGFLYWLFSKKAFGAGALDSRRWTGKEPK